jgi:dolichol-phosphate mannosyltransferase
LLSLVIPAHNEADGITPTLRAFAERLRLERIPFELVVVDDHSTDGTDTVLAGLHAELPELRRVENPRSGGFGHAVLAGLEQFAGDAVCIVMADASDDPADVVTYYRRLLEGYDCVFGSRFLRGATVVDYPRHKLVINRMANTFIRMLFGLRLNDITNAFKCYRREVIDGCSPLLSKHFNLTVELPLKAIVRGYSYTVVPISWYNRTTGVSKLKIKEMGSRYLFIVLYVWLEKFLSRGDYTRPVPTPRPPDQALSSEPKD